MAAAAAIATEARDATRLELRLLVWFILFYLYITLMFILQYLKVYTYECR
jgi:hypothetical protein